MRVGASKAVIGATHACRSGSSSSGSCRLLPLHRQEHGLGTGEPASPLLLVQVVGGQPAWHHDHHPGSVRVGIRAAAVLLWHAELLGHHHGADGGLQRRRIVQQRRIV